MNNMLNYKEISRIKLAYTKNQNIMKILRSKNKTHLNSPEMILYSYDLQSGSYLKKLKNLKFRSYKKKLGVRISKIISELHVETILEAGVGEASTLYDVMNSKLLKKSKFLGFDISLSRLLYAQKYLSKLQKYSTLFCSELCDIPLKDNSIDLTYTFHAIEPNHGREITILGDYQLFTPNT